MYVVLDNLSPHKLNYRFPPCIKLSLKNIRLRLRIFHYYYIKLINTKINNNVLKSVLIENRMYRLYLLNYEFITEGQCRNCVQLINPSLL